MADTQDQIQYRVKVATWIGPHLKQKDDIVKMTEDAAKYYVPHVLEKVDDKKPAPAKAEKAKG
ncbi:MAG: hypothetical protein CSA70_03680 [Rhodobacterales bacterium]|nr:MAG: hypothetical protein CSA70_03680 [Rhodobacterales bacterium]